MAKRNSGRRGARPRKRRTSARGAQSAQGAQGAQASESVARPVERAPQRDPGRLGDLQAYGERPKAPWHPLPLSEILILVGAIGAIVGLGRGVSNGAPTLLAGIGAVVLGTVEVTLREHMSGYRSHALMLALIPPIILHSVVVLGLAAVIAVPRWLNVAMLGVDGALFAFLYKLLRVRFIDARRERVFAGRR